MSTLELVTFARESTLILLALAILALAVYRNGPRGSA